MAAHQIPLVTFFCVSVYGVPARGIGTYLERFWVKIPDYFCLSTYHNLLAHPEASVEVGSERFRVKATVTSGEERQRLFDRQAAQMPIFVEYQQKTSRQLPVLVLTRLD